MRHAVWRRARRCRVSDAGGFTLVEALVTMGITVSILGAVFRMLAPARDLFRSVPEAAELEQRRRYLVQTLGHDIRMAGHGTSEADGAFAYGTAAVLPYRIGQERSDARAGVHFRHGVLTVAYVPSEPEATSRAMRSGDRHVMAVSRTYYLRETAGGSQLMRYDGIVTDAPVLDDVVALSFELLAEPDPPRLITHDRDGMPVPPRTTYGPLPPPVGTDVAGDGWAAGENCVFSVLDGAHLSRLPRLSEDRRLQRLAPEQLIDGPWCTGTTDDEPYDADLLRIRQVHVRATLQARQAFRGAAGTLFRRAGTARNAGGLVPDREVRFDVSPRNLAHGR